MARFTMRGCASTRVVRDASTPAALDEMSSVRVMRPGV